MSVLDTARGHIVGLVERLADNAPQRITQQSLTIGCSVVDAEEVWRDANRISQVLGELGEVAFTEPNRYHWRLHLGEVNLDWDSRLVSEAGGLRFVGEDGNEIIVGYTPAPNQLGTEMTLRTKSPVTGLLAGAAAFKILYRIRALLQTGEVPTIRQNPSARASAR